MVKRDNDEVEGADPDVEAMGGEMPASSQGIAFKKPKLMKSQLYKPPTSDELIALKETQNMYQSSLFKLQVIIL